jgi:hypothetical protein
MISLALCCRAAQDAMPHPSSGAVAARQADEAIKAHRATSTDAFDRGRAS